MGIRDADSIAGTAASLWGAESVRVAGAGDKIGGRTPLAVLEPGAPAIVGEMLRWADGEGLAVVPRGAGTKLAWGAAPSRADVILSTTRLSTPIDHCAGDLTATVPAGVPLARVNALLGRERQWLPLDPPAGDRATIGGILATNDSGPRRQKYGAPRDLIIGVELALVDGRTAKAGGRVVKNVAGYDLSRLLCGSFGTLAVITGATFKLSPLPAASRTVIATIATTRQLTTLTLALMATPLAPSAVECDWPAKRMLIRFETVEAAASRQAAAVCELCTRHGAEASLLAGDAEADAWSRYGPSVPDADDTVVKMAVLTSEIGALVDAVESTCAARSVGYRVTGRAAVGVLLLTLTGNPQHHPGIVADLRRAAAGRGGSAVIVSSTATVLAGVDPWGDLGDGFRVMQAVKARFDPNRTLNPGRGPGGL